MFKVKGPFLMSGIIFSVVVLIGWAAEVQSQEKYPTRAINVIVPFAPGGSTDVAARINASFLSKKWGVPVNVINKPGGNTIPGQLEVYSSPPDGYTMLGDGLPMCSLLEVVVKDLPFRVMDRAFIAITSFSPQDIIVPATSSYKTLKDLMEDAKKDPENFVWSSLGGVSGNDFGARMFFKAAGVDVGRTKPVMSKGGAQGAALVAGGHIKMDVSTITTSLPHISAGTIRVLAVCFDKRDPLLPDVPTTAELGYPSIYLPFWQGFSGPPKLPGHIVDIWTKALQEMTKDKEYLGQLEKARLRLFYHSPREMIEYIKKEREVAEDVYGVKKK
ncbi:MAG TPA: tripartite tricarboxylate transporter substrate binding protein [Thermodesulfobacteriota bacterium]|nr:tripartite tricarboxylate transporter substrate binding protein [Thermodesulfobacteriota bacterium]